MSRTPSQVDTLEYKLGKRGFRREPRPTTCASCGQMALFHYALPHTNLGGRVIDWCHACDQERSWTRPDGDTLVEQADFTIEGFLA